MRPMRQKPKLESRIVDEIRARLFDGGWTLVEKTHGNEFSGGWPDLLCFRPAAAGTSSAWPHGDLIRWVEVKRPKRAKKTCLTPAQRARFSRWEKAGLGVWVLTSADEVDKLFGEPNWGDFA